MTGSLSASPAWKALAAHFAEIQSDTMKDMFAADPARFDKFSLDFEGILMDFSKNRINDETMKLLYGLSSQQDVTGLAKKMFSGEKISKYWYFSFVRHEMYFLRPMDRLEYISYS